MTQEEKQLLLKDLCTRLPYGVKVHGVFLNYNKDKNKILYEECDGELNYENLKRYETLRPYLRPMSSMTEEERFEVEQIIYDVEVQDDFLSLLSSSIKRLSYAELLAVFEWLNKHHFDFNGLIPKGLAIVAPEGMYN